MKKIKTQLFADPRLAGKTQFNLTFPVILIAALLCSFIIGLNFAQAANIDENYLVNLANYERHIRGLNTLEINPNLYLAARSKAQDMLTKDYFDHYRSDGRSPWDFIHDAGYNYQLAGENLAIYFQTSEGIHKAWMASPGHRDNIIKADYQDIAVAAVEGGFAGRETTVVVEMFGRPMNKQYSTIDNLFVKIQNFIIGLTF